MFAHCPGETTRFCANPKDDEYTAAAAADVYAKNPVAEFALTAVC